nr:caspase family protein [Nocardia bovistercoris]
MAIIVGIETNKMRWPALNGPMGDARHFTEWLLERGVPARNITVLAAPLDENRTHCTALELSGVTVTEANADSIIHRFRIQLPKERSDLLLVHWGGHGLEWNRGERLLMFPESAEEKQDALNFTHLLGMLRKPKYRRHRLQQFIIDACAVRAKTDWQYLALCDDYLDVKSVGQEQQIYYAAGAGEAAMNSVAEAAGYFSKEVFRALCAPPGGMWPPDFRKIELHVNPRFEKLRDDGSTSQVPNRVYIKLRDREEELSFTADPAAPDGSARALGMLLLERPEFEELHDILLGVHPPSDIAALYRKATEGVDVSDPGSSDVHAMVDSLRRPTRADPLFEFLVRLAKSVRDRGAKCSLQAWLAGAAPRHGIDLAELEARIEDGQPTYLVVRVIPDGLGHGYEVRAWEYSKRGALERTMPEPLLNFDEIESEVGRLVTEYGTPAPQVEFLVRGEVIRTEEEKRNGLEPKNLIDAPFEEMMVSGDSTLGSMCRVVVRPLFKSRDDTRRRAAHDAAWSTLMGLKSYQESVIWWAENGSIDPSVLGHHVCVAFAWTTRPPAKVRWNLLRELFYAGTPIALWHRAGRTGGREPLRRLLEGQPLAELPATVRRRRANYRKYSLDDCEHEARDLVLLWDDPTRGPAPEIMRAPITVGGA